MEKNYFYLFILYLFCLSDLFIFIDMQEQMLIDYYIEIVYLTKIQDPRCHGISIIINL